LFRIEKKNEIIPQIVILAKELPVLEETLLIEETVALRADKAFLVPVHVHQVEYVLVVYIRVATRAHRLLALLGLDLRVFC
jgi:hypothetical protein